MTDFEVLKNICERRKSTREFLDIPVPAELLEEISDIAGTAPFASGKKTWDIIIIDDKPKLKEIADSIKSYVNDFSSFVKDDFREGFVDYSKSFTFFENAPAAFVLTYRITPSTSLSIDREKIKNEDYEKIQRWELENAAKSISCPAMLILLAAESLGLGACYMTGALIAEEIILKQVTNKKERKIGAIIPVGYKAEL